MKLNKLFSALLLVFVGLVMLYSVANAQMGPGDSQVPTPVPPSPTVEPTPPELPPGTIDPDTIPALPDFLEFLAGPGGWVAIGVFISLLLVKWAWFNAQTDAVKQGVVVGITIAVSTLARVLIMVVPSAFWAWSAPFWLIIAGSIMTWVGSQLNFYLAIKPSRELDELGDDRVSLGS
jgi:hypothetical protein